MSIVEAYAKLHGKEHDWFITGLPFVFGRKSEKSPEHFLDITLGEGTKTVSREHAVLTYSEEKVFVSDSQSFVESLRSWNQGEKWLYHKS